MTRFLIVICLAVFACNCTFSQTKEDCVNYIRLTDRIKEKDLWIETSLSGTKLLRKYRMNYNSMYWTKESVLDMKYVEAVVLEFDEDYQSWYPAILFNGMHCIEKEIDDDGTITPLNPWNRKTYYFFKEKSEAVKAQRMFSRLAVLCGAKLISK